MSPTSAQKYTPEVSAEQWMLDRTVKHLRKLRWIGKEHEAEKIARILGEMRLPQLLGDYRKGSGEAKNPAPARDVERTARSRGPDDCEIPPAWLLPSRR
jgi:hypothetical protein